MDKIKNASLYLNKGAQYLAKGKTDISITAFKKAIKNDPDMVGAYFDLALAYQKKSLMAEAIENFNTVIKLNPNDYEALNLLGRIYDIENKPQKAFKYYKKAISIKPDFAPALTNMGAAYTKLGKFNLALNFYQKSIEVNPDYSVAYTFLGNTLLAQANIDDAILCYKIAIEKNPDDSEAYNNLGAAYARQLKFGNAITAFKKALALDGNSEDALQNLAVVYTAAKKNVAGIKYLKKVFKRFPDDGVVAANLHHELCDIGLWDDAASIKIKLDQITTKEIASGVKPGEDPFLNAVHNADPNRNFEVARLWSNVLIKNLNQNKKFTYEQPKNQAKRKLKIGYFSAHFHNHPTSHLIAKLLESHDRNKFEIFVYSAGPDDGSTYFNKIRKSCDHLIHLFVSNFSNSALEVNKDQIDILIDLDGYTDGNRLQTFALKPAPIQVTYLGFPGTTGSDFINYIIADKVVLPVENQKYFSEKVIYLPDSYQVNDNTQKISQKKYTKKFFNIPENSFVYASFNATYKIEPQVFKVWMSILKRVPQSVLWLLKNSNLAEKNLKNEARKVGINPNRLIFSPRFVKDKHLSRLALANLSLDPFICNGHTTTSDSLWAGVPVLTLQGNHFASRVSSSLLTATKLSQLITYSPKEYENLAVYLANNPKKLTSIRQTLQVNRLTAPLFDTQKFTMNLENAYQKIWQIYQSGQKPKNISIKTKHDDPNKKY